jgi:membrane protein implicated in regulation of membrane protease activity
VAVLRENENDIPVHFPLSFWVSLSLGILLMLYSFMADAIQMLPASTAALNDLRPTQFNWPVYLLGLGLAFVSVLQIMIKKKKK